MGNDIRQDRNSLQGAFEIYRSDKGGRRSIAT